MTDDSPTPTTHNPSKTIATGERPDDVSTEEWGYWSAQAWAGCGVIFSLMLAMFLPLIMIPMLGSFQGKLVGFGIAGAVGLLSIAVISRLTYRNRLARRETLRLVLAERQRAPNTPDGS